MITETPGLLEHMLAKAQTPRPDCMIWPTTTDRGYGRIQVDTKSNRAHRVVWELKFGPIPDDLVIDHLCRIRSCINTDHMELVTPEENTARRPWAGSPLLPPRPRALATRTHCRRGHPYPDDYFSAGRGRTCKVCKRETDRVREKKRTADRRAARAAALGTPPTPGPDLAPGQ